MNTLLLVLVFYIIPLAVTLTYAKKTKDAEDVLIFFIPVVNILFTLILLLLYLNNRLTKWILK